MNRDRVEGSWKQLKGRGKAEWGKLTHDQRGVIAGKDERLAGRVQEQYGIAREEAEKQVQWLASSIGAETFKE